MSLQSLQRLIQTNNLAALSTISAKLTRARQKLKSHMAAPLPDNYFVCFVMAPSQP
jgi:hypothetical protein